MATLFLGGCKKQEHNNVVNEKKKVEEFNAWGDWSGLEFTNEDGTKYKIEDSIEKPTVVLYWASWCPYCHTLMDNINNIEEEIKGNGGELLLVNKLDNKKETKESALAYMQKKNITQKVVFDENAVVYNTKNLDMVPTFIVLDKTAKASFVSKEEIPDSDEISMIMDEVAIGKTKYLEDSITKNLLNSDGGIRTNYNNKGTEIPSGQDVLSESQGLLMLHAVNSNNQQLFDKLYNYNKEYLINKETGLFSWVVTDKKEVTTNALIDDFRIFKALYYADKKFGGYKSDVEQLSEALYKYCVSDEQLVDFYDFKLGQKANRLTLCYIDIEALTLLEKVDKKWSNVLDKAKVILDKGFISDEFPIYKSWYDYNAEKYNTENIHMGEAMVTLLHLSRVGELKAETLDWMETQLKQGGIYAIYDKEGRPTLDGRYESTAIYSIGIQILMEEKRMDLASRMLDKLEELRVLEKNSTVNGMFGNKDGTGIYSYDQCNALLAYESYMSYLEDSH